MGKNPFQAVAREKLGGAKRASGGRPSGGSHRGVSKSVRRKASAATPTTKPSSKPSHQGIVRQRSTASSSSAAAADAPRDPKRNTSAAALAPFLAAGVAPPLSPRAQTLTSSSDAQTTKGGSSAGAARKAGRVGGPRALGAQQRVVFVGGEDDDVRARVSTRRVYALCLFVYARDARLARNLRSPVPYDPRSTVKRILETTKSSDRQRTC